MRRTLIVGDVHGCNTELGELLQVAGWTPKDELLLTGDIIAKGPDSAGVMRRVRALGAQSVLGNHDALLLEVRCGKVKKAHHEEVALSLTTADWRWLQLRPLWVELPEYDAVVVHGGLLPGVALAEQPRHVVLNLRSFDARGRPSMRVDGGIPWAARWTGPRHVVFGHDALRGLQRHPFATGLDTGCVYGGSLTALWLPENRLVSVPCRQWQAPERQ